VEALLRDGWWVARFPPVKIREMHTMEHIGCAHEEKEKERGRGIIMSGLEVSMCGLLRRRVGIYIDVLDQEMMVTKPTTIACDSIQKVSVYEVKLNMELFDTNSA
jgi:hypothetical protein